MEEIPTMVVAAAALADADGRVLLQRRPVGKPMAGLWEFPGGKLERGETPEQALVRELHEELGIGIDAVRLEPAAFVSAPVAGRHMILLLYLCRAWNGAPEPLHADEIRWVRPAEMGGLPMPPADRPLVEALARWPNAAFSGAR